VRRKRRVGAIAGAAALAALVAGGCGVTPSGALSASAGAPVATPGATLPTLGPEPTATQEPTPSLPALVDRSLLAILPAQVAGSPVEEDIDGEREFGADPGGTVRRYAAAVVGDAGQNIASVSVAALDPADMAAFFPAWRADYDEAACAANEGLGETATTTVGGREVESTSCTGGVRVYHVRLHGDALLVSIMSIGPDDFGAKLIEGLRE